MCVGFIDVIVADHLPSGNKKAISVNVKKTSRFGRRWMILFMASLKLCHSG
jgi:hypothetical protein